MTTIMKKEFIKYSTISIPPSKGEGVGDWLRERFLEKFGNDELINQYLSSDRRKIDFEKYIQLSHGTSEEDGEDYGRISIEEYQKFLDELREALPSKFRKKGVAGKPGFDNVMPVVELGMGALTFEAAEKEIANKALAILKVKKEDKGLNQKSQVTTFLESLGSQK